MTLLRGSEPSPFTFSLGKTVRRYRRQRRKRKDIIITSSFPPSSLHLKQGNSGTRRASQPKPRETLSSLHQKGTFLFLCPKHREPTDSSDRTRPLTPHCSFICCSYSREAHIQRPYMFYFGLIFFFLSLSLFFSFL